VPVIRMIFRLQVWLASRKLQKLIDQRRNSYEVIDYRKRRAAALKGLGRA
jgi:hypothetical protein